MSEKGNFNESLDNIFENSESLKNYTDSEISEIKDIYSGKSTFQYIRNNLDNFSTNCVDLCGMFYNCSSLLSIKGINYFEKENISGIGSMFYNCSSLISLPDISNWNTNNVTNINKFF